MSLSPRPRALLVALLALVAVLAGSAVAQAAVPATVARDATNPSGYGAFNYVPQNDGGPPRAGFVAFYSDDDRAGMRTQITNVIGIDNATAGGLGKGAKDVKVEAPAGALAAVANADFCSIADYNADTCPQTSLIADTTALAILQAPLTILGTPLLPVGAAVPTNGSVYNIAPPQADENDNADVDAPPGTPKRITARLGIILRPAGGAQEVRQFLDVRVRDESDYGLEFNLQDLSNSVTLPGEIPVPIAIQSLRFTFLATVNGGKPFAENPTNCDPKPGSATISSYAAPDAFSNVARSTNTYTDCGNVPFDPKITFSTSDPRAMSTGDFTVEQTQPETLTAPDGTQRAPANFKKVIPILPKGVTLNPAGAVGVPPCTEQEFGPQGQVDHCPTGSIIGDVAFFSPPVGNLTGNAYLGTQLPNGDINVYITAKSLGVITKLKLVTQPDRGTGQVFNTFDNLPLVPVSNFKFVFRGGSRAVLTSGPTCGTLTGSAISTPYSGTPDVTSTGTLDIGKDANGKCSTDTASVSSALQSTTKVAGADTNPEVVLQRPDRGALLKAVRNVLPEGLAGRLPLVPRCPDAIATTSGLCPDSSRIGVATTFAGVGDQPAQLQGPVYLGGPINGSLASLVIYVRAIVGPIDAGTVIVRAPLNTDYRTGRLIVDADVPQITGGIPTYIQKLDIAVNKPGFGFNPTGCDVRSLDVTAQTTNGLTTTSSSPYQATNCGVLPYKPDFGVTIDSPTVVPAGTRVPITASLTQAAGQTNNKLVGLRLPTTVRPDVLALDRTCQQRQLDSGTCPARSTVGQAVATTPALEAPLTGPVRLAQTGVLPPQSSGVAAPWLVVDLAGQTRLRLDGSNRLPPQGGLEAMFSAVPDLPVSAFNLSFPGGPTGVFQLRDGLCERPLGAATLALRSQDGRVINTSVPVDAPVCAGRPTMQASIRGSVVKAPSVTMDFKAGTLKSKARPVERVRATLPSQLQLAARGGRVRIAVAKTVTTVKRGRKLVKRTVSTAYRARRLGSRSVEVLVPKGTTQVRMTLDRGAVKLSKRGRTALGKRRAMTVEAVANATETAGRTTRLSADLAAKR